MSLDAQEQAPVTNEERDALIQQWLELKKQLEVAKEAENNVRQLLYTRLFPNAVIGTNTIELGNGYKIKAVKKENYNLDKDAEKVHAMLDKLEKTGNEGSFISERLVKWKSELSLSEYKQLDPKYKKIVDTVLTISDATPAIEFVEPKAKK